MNSLDRFTELYPSDLDFTTADRAEFNKAPRPWDELFTSYSFGRGIYRLVRPIQRAKLSQTVRTIFADIPTECDALSYDWLGRVFFAQKDIAVNVQGSVFMCSLATDELLKIPASVESFHNDILVDHSDEAVEFHLFNKYLEFTGISRIEPSACVDFIKPLWLGGRFEVNNLMATDMEVMWEVVGQLLLQVRSLPVGARVDRVGFKP